MPSLVTMAMVACASAVGGVLRLCLALTVDLRLGGSFPWGTLLVNILGCLAIGVLYAGTSDLQWRLVIGTGLLGGFTTFSAFSQQSLELAMTGRPGSAALYVVASVVACLLAVTAGMLLTRMLRGV